MRRRLTSITLDAARVGAWGRLADDANRLHTDAEFAATTPFEVPIVHGHFVACLALDAMQQASGSTRIRPIEVAIAFMAPVAVGSTVDLHWDEDERALTVTEHDGERLLVELRERPDPRVRLVVARAVVDEYAEAAHDRNPIHMDDAAARRSGFDGAIAHGMLTLGWASARLLQHVDARDLRLLRARFAAPVPVGDDIRLVVDEAASDHTSLRVLRGDGTVVLTMEAEHEPGASAAIPDLPEDAEIVAETELIVDAAAAAGFARAVGADDDVFTSTERARAAGFPSILAVPTLAFAATALGHLVGDPGNAGVPVPDPVADCQAWARTTQPVVHAGQEFRFVRPLVAGERIRARTAVVARSERTSSSGRQLRFTAVRTVLRAQDGVLVAMSEMNLVVVDA